MQHVGLRSAPHLKAQSAVAATYAEATNRVTFDTGVRFVRIDACGSAANFLYIVSSSLAIVTPATPLAADASRHRFTLKTKANGGTQIELAFSAEVKYLYFLTDTGTADIAVAGYSV